jgi:two-component system invasion response regulator UvrY
MKILIIDDHAVVRRGMMAILSEHGKDLEFGEAENGSQGFEAAMKGEWDLAIVDISMPGRNGLDLIRDIRNEKPALPLLVVSTHLEKDYALRAFKLGAAGYVTKQSAPDTLATAVRHVASGGRYVSSALAELLAGSLSGVKPGSPHEMLSNRELQVLNLIASGKSVKEIGAELALSEKTVATYRARISEKMGLSTNVDLARYAMRHGLID